MIIIDSSALFSMDDLPEGDIACPPGVIAELRRYKDPRLDIWGDMLRVSDCTRESIERVNETARKSGDAGRLSPIDITVIALALDLDGRVYTDDFSIQNVCSLMGIPYTPVGTEGIRRTERWNYQCIGCRKWYKERLDECPICGSKMKAFRKRRFMGICACI